jgi:hypothetical protein
MILWIQISGNSRELNKKKYLIIILTCCCMSANAIFLPILISLECTQLYIDLKLILSKLCSVERKITCLLI